MIFVLQMAEGGGRKGVDEDDKDGKIRTNFVEKHEEDAMEGTKGFGFCEPDLGVPLKRERDRIIVVPDEDKVPQSRDADNPFSFRHFLNKDQTGTSDAQLRRAKGMTSGSSPHTSGGNSAARHNVARSHSATQDDDRSGKPPRVALEFASGLPDFVQDHLIQDNYSAFHENGDGARNVVDSPSQCHNSVMYHQEVLPDFAPSKSAADSGVSSTVTKISSIPSREDLAVGPSCKPKATRKSLGVPQKADTGAGSSSANSSGSLPDFLSDGPMLSNHVELASVTPRKTRSQRHRPRSQTNDDDIDDGECEIVNPADVLSLIEDRNYLRRKLEETCERLAVESATVFELRKEVELLRRKEVDETVALEHIVEQVEANLQGATQRAVNSETVVSKLRQDAKNLQCEVSRLRAENLSLRSGDENVIGRAKKASEQITEATNTAEHQLRQLLAGLDSLRLISAVLSDVDRVTEDDAGNSASGNI